MPHKARASINFLPASVQSAPRNARHAAALRRSGDGRWFLYDANFEHALTVPQNALVRFLKQEDTTAYRVDPGFEEHAGLT